MAENRVIDTKRVFSGRVINLDVDTVSLANGVEINLEIIRHPGASAVVPLIMDPDPKVILLRQFRHAAGDTIWEIPAGVLEKGEKPEDCAVRELAEESGARAGKIEHLSTILTTPGFTNEVIHLFLATEIEMGVASPEDDEQLETEVRTWGEVMEMIENGTIRDAKTISALLLTKNRLRL